MIILTILVLSSAVVALFTVLPISNSGVWWVRGAEFPRLQLLCWAIGNIFFSLWLLDSTPFLAVLALVNLGCVFYHGFWVYAYLPIFPVEVPRASSKISESSICILSSNVLMTNTNTQSLIDLIKSTNPDVVITLESDARWQKALDTLSVQYPHTIKAPFDNFYGMHVYSRLALKEKYLEYLVKEDIPSVHCVVTLNSGKDINLRVLHPMPPSPTESYSSTRRDIELIIVGQKVAEHDVPTIVAGDLNDVAWSKTSKLFKHISGLKDPRIGRGFFNTFHAAYPFLRWPLDHMFHSSHFSLVSLKRLRLKGSDHFALLTHLQLENLNASDRSNRDPSDKELESQRMDDASATGVPTLNR
jgi:endonuclease/exonuclease/phosphatase (EEP) superfamily protein YafD